MPLIQLIVLAIIQGVTEFLPISSSAHLVLAPLVVSSWSDQGALIDVAAHVGSLFAVLIYFRQETGSLFRGGIDTLTFKDSQERSLFLKIAIATIPVLFLGAIFALTGLIDRIRSPYVIAATSIIFGVLLWHADRQPTEKEGLARISWRETILIGFAQMLSIVPGTSRSGATMTAARYLGWSREEAARFSMLLAIPTISALGIFAGVDLVREGADATMEAAAIVAVLSFFAALLAIAVLMRLTRSISFTPFVIYRLIFGVVILAFADRLVA
ncbi:MAG: undecaprenyl-diphosphate phosphatase [Pseudomonadota bacterium]